MIKLIFLLVAIIILTSCTRDESTIPLNDASTTLDTFVHSTMAIENDGKVALRYPDEKILYAFQKFSNKTKLGLKPQTLAIETIDKKNYLRIYSENNKVSTVALILEDNGQYRTGDTICTSSDCASGGGCIPDGTYCTQCYPEGTQPGGPITGDCTRTTSGGNN